MKSVKVLATPGTQVVKEIATEVEKKSLFRLYNTQHSTLPSKVNGYQGAEMVAGYDRSNRADNASKKVNLIA